MKRAQFLSILGVICLLGIGIGPFALAGQGAFPGSNGRPFQALQGQITDLDTFLHQELAALWTKVGELQAAIDANNSRDDAQDALISLLGGALAQLEARVAATEGSIEGLVAKDALLDALIQALQGKTDDLQAQLNAQGDRIDLLVLADQALQQLIDALRARVELLESNMSIASADIATLKQQMAEAQSAIAAKQNRIYDYCPSGSSIRVIHSDGIVHCETATGGFTSFTVQRDHVAGNSGDASPFTTSSVTATCPSGSKRTGGGFYVDNDLMFVIASFPTGDNSWITVVRGTWPIPVLYYSHIVCLRLN